MFSASARPRRSSRASTPSSTPSRRSSRISPRSTGAPSRSRSVSTSATCCAAAGRGSTRCGPPIRSSAFPWWRIAGSYIAGVGVNSILPARAGDVTKIYLAKQSVPNSTYPAVTSSFFVESVFDMTVGSLVLVFAITQGVLPSVPDLSSLPAFDLSFWADHPRFFLFTFTFFVIALLTLYAVLSVRAVVFWRRIKQGVVILTDFPPLPARGGRLAGGRLAVQVRRVLLLPGGVQHRWLRGERAAGDERAGAFDPDAVHARRRGRPAGAARRRVLRTWPPGRRCSPTASASRSRSPRSTSRLPCWRSSWWPGRSSIRSIVRRGEEERRQADELTEELPDSAVEPEPEFAEAAAPF